MPKFTKRQTRTWRRPETVPGPNVSLAIDDEIRAMKLQPRWSINDALEFGRLAMQVALEDAHYYEGRHASDGFKYWKRTAETAREAEVALGRLWGQIGEGGLPTGIFPTITRLPKSFTKSGKIKLQLSPRQKPNGGYFTPDDSRAEVARLAAARQLVGEIATHSAARCKQLERSSKINDRRADYGKQYFVLRIVEAWIWLTGKGPGLGSLPERNPCLRFIQTALVDLGMHTEDFEKSALRALQATVKWLDQMMPETTQPIASIAKQGPVWADHATTKQPSGQGS